MAVLPFKPKTKQEPIVTRYQYHLQREVELRENLVAARESLKLKMEQAMVEGATESELGAARDMLAEVDALLTADDIEWRPFTG